MKNIKRKIMVCVASALMILVLAVPAFAEEGTNSGYYLQTDSGTSAAIEDVTVRIISNGSSNNFEVEYDNIDLPAKTDGTKQRVVDALCAVQGDGNTAPQFLNVNDNPITSTSTYFRSIKMNNVTYAPPTELSIQGWMFRINDKFPLIETYGEPNTSSSIFSTTGNAKGETISTAYIKSNDVITVYYDIPLPGSAADYTRITDVSNTSSSITASVQSSKSWFNKIDFSCWHILDFSSFNTTVYLYDEDGVELTHASTSSGSVTFNRTVTTGEKYTLRVKTARLAGAITTVSCKKDYTAN